MGQVAEIFNSSFMRGLAEQAEKQKYQQEFAYREQRAKEEDAFRQLQFQQTVAMADEANQDRDRAYGLQEQQLHEARLGRFGAQYDPISPDSPMYKALGKSGLDITAAASEAGQAFNPGSYAPGTRWVSKSDVQALLARENMDYQLQKQEEMMNRKLADINAPLTAWDNFVQNAPEAIIEKTSTEEKVTPGFKYRNPFLSAFSGKAHPLGRILGDDFGTVSFPEKRETIENTERYINPEYLNKFGDTYKQILFSANKSNLAGTKADDALAVLDRHFNSFNKDGATTDQLLQFVNNMDKWGYSDKLNANAIISLDALMQRRLAQAQAQGKYQDKEEMAKIERALKLMKLREAEFKASQEGY